MSYKDFYSLKDFYNFIKTPKNAPATHRLCSLLLYPCIVDARTGKTIEQAYPTIFNHDNYKKFTLLANNINLPNFKMGGTQDESVSVTTPEGLWKGMGNTNLVPSSTDFTVNFLDTHDPIIENFIYEWFLLCVRADAGEIYPFPRMDLIVKYFKENDWTNDRPNINFIYKLTGIYPTAIDACTVSHQADSQTDYFRKVTFTFNNMYKTKEKQDIEYGWK